MTATLSASDWIYLDNNATTRPASRVVSAMGEALVLHWGNASSSHAVGQEAKRLLGAARAQVAALLDARPAEVVFTSGATEANHAALSGAMAPGETPHVVISAVEHAGYLKAARRLAAEGRIRLDTMPVDEQGRVNVSAAIAMIRPGTRLVSLMSANNETGVLQPLDEVLAHARDVGAVTHVDATQSIGKLPFSFARSGVDLVSLSAHKLHGPKGVGALVMRKGLEWPPLFVGSQERGRRGGTENLPGIVGFGVSAELAAANLEADAQPLTQLRDTLEAGLCERLPVRVFGDAVERLPNTLMLRIGALDADLVLNRLEQAGIIAASGSACSSGGSEPSHVLLAMGVPPTEARCAIRLSLSRDNHLAQIHTLLDRLPPLLHERLQAAA